MTKETSNSENTEQENTEENVKVEDFSVKKDISSSFNEFFSEDSLDESQTDDESQTGKSGKETTYEELIDNLARKQGWVPQEEFRGDPEKWRPAQDYLEGAPLVSRLKKQHQTIKDLQKTNDAALIMLQKQTERYLQKEAAEIQDKKRLAIEEGDVDKVETLEKQHQELLNEMTFEKPTSQAKDSPDHAKYEEFAFKNKEWFNNNTPKNAAMVKYADALNTQLSEEYPDIPVEARLQEIEKMVKNEFFRGSTNPNRDKAPAVASRSVKTVSSKVTFNDMPNEVKQVIRSFKMKNPQLDVDKYAQELVATGAVTI